MGTYAVTGSASGMGTKSRRSWRRRHTVIGVDIKQADVVADVWTGEGRQAAAAATGGVGWRFDGAVLAAGLGPVGPLTVRA